MHIVSQTSWAPQRAGECGRSRTCAKCLIMKVPLGVQLIPLARQVLASAMQLRNRENMFHTLLSAGVEEMGREQAGVIRSHTFARRFDFSIVLGCGRSRYRPPMEAAGQHNVSPRDAPPCVAEWLSEPSAAPGASRRIEVCSKL